jgi:hypothetical protein
MDWPSRIIDDNTGRSPVTIPLNLFAERKGKQRKISPAASVRKLIQNFMIASA